MSRPTATNNKIGEHRHQQHSGNTKNVTLKVYIPFVICCLFIVGLNISMYSKGMLALFSSSSWTQSTKSTKSSNYDNNKYLENLPTILSNSATTEDTDTDTTIQDIDNPSYYKRYRLDNNNDDTSTTTRTTSNNKASDVGPRPASLQSRPPLPKRSDQLKQLRNQKLQQLKQKQQQQQQSNAMNSNQPKYQPPSKLKLPKPIINVGFPKSGTSSIFEFFHCNGLKGQHWYCCEPQPNYKYTTKKMLMSQCMLRNLAKRHNGSLSVNILDDCGNYDFYSEINGPRHKHGSKNKKDHGQVLDSGIIDPSTIPRLFFPQHHYLNLIHDQYPNATFILHTRPTKDWVKSVLRWNPALKIEFGTEFYIQQQGQGKQQGNWAYQFMNEYMLNGYGDVAKSHITNTSIRIERIQNYENYDVFLPWLYEYHIEFIKAFVNEYPSHTLIQVDITNNQTGQTLADAFGLHADCWGNHNKINDRNKVANKANKICKIPKIITEDSSSIKKGTCGQGSRGNGICSDGTCCSQYGWCGITDAHCCS